MSKTSSNHSMKTAELIGALLDYWVARAEGFSDADIHWRKDGDFWMENFSYGYSPSTDWSQGGPIIERENIATSNHRQGGMVAHQEWTAKMLGSPRIHFGPTPLIAAMRAYVASKFGETVEDATNEDK